MQESFGLRFIQSSISVLIITFPTIFNKFCYDHFSCVQTVINIIIVYDFSYKLLLVALVAFDISWETGLMPHVVFFFSIRHRVADLSIDQRHTRWRRVHDIIGMVHADHVFIQRRSTRLICLWLLRSRRTCVWWGPHAWILIGFYGVELAGLDILLLWWLNVAA